MQNQQNQSLLNSIYKNTQMAIWAIDTIINNVENDGLISVIKKQKCVYEDINNNIENLAYELNIELKQLNFMLKSMSWMGIKMGTLTNKKTSHIADKLIQGTTMGITDVITNASDNKSANIKILETANKLKICEEEFIESLKVFLKR